jgi:hypothetical protein
VDDLIFSTGAYYAHTLINTFTVIVVINLTVNTVIIFNVIIFNVIVLSMAAIILDLADIMYPNNPTANEGRGRVE